MTTEFWVLLAATVVWVVYRFVSNVRAAQERINGLLADVEEWHPRHGAEASCRGLTDRSGSPETRSHQAR